MTWYPRLGHLLETPKQRLWASLGLILLLSSVFIGVSFHAGVDTKRTIFESLVQTASSRVQARFDNFIAPIRDNLEIGRRWGAQGLLDIDDIAGMNARFIPLLEQFPQISSLMVADQGGNEYFLLREGDHWLTRLAKPGEWRHRTRWSQWSNATKETKQWWEEQDYDPRQRPWYQGAMQRPDDAKPHWTSPYLFYTKQRPGITVSMRGQDQAGKLGTFVVGFDLLLASISRFTMESDGAEAAKVFIVTADGRMIGAPADPRFRDPKSLEKALLQPLSSLGLPTVARAVSTWSDASGNLQAQTPEPFRFAAEGRQWWAEFLPLPLASETLWLGYIAPERLILQRLGTQQRNLFLWTLLGVGVTAILAVLSVVRIYRHALAEQRRAANPEPARHYTAEHVAELIGHGEGTRIEFKSTLRRNLKSGRFGKEIELAWLKNVVAFLNSNGGTLLIGVNDAGDVIGLDEDRFANDDKALLHVRNLIKQHVGLEFSRYIHFEVVDMGRHKVLVIHCKAADNPVFLLHDGDEVFYIRTGPAAVKLAPSKTVQYLDARRSNRNKAS